MASLIYTLVPFKQIGPLRFGMSREEVFGLLGEVERVHKTYTGGLVEMRKNISTIYKNDKLNEVTFSPGAHVLVNNQLVLKQAGIDYLVNTYEHYTKVGYTIFPELGIAFTGFGKSKDAKVIMAFDKKTLKKYLAS